MYRELIQPLTFVSAILAASALHAEEGLEVKFKTMDPVPTTLAECMEALEKGTSLPVFGLEQNEKSHHFVVYGGYFFAFLFYPTRTALCTKVSPSEAP